MLIDKKDYDLIGIMDDEVDALDSFVTDFDGCIGDAIFQIGDNYTPIYHYDVWENARNIEEYIEEAIASGLAVIEGNQIDLIRIFQAGYYQYYTQSLYNNLDVLCFNYAVNKINELLEGEEINDIDVEEIEGMLNDRMENIDNNDRFDIIDDIADEIVEYIKDYDYDE